jgi:hypothetical protein
MYYIEWVYNEKTWYCSVGVLSPRIFKPGIKVVDVWKQSNEGWMRCVSDVTVDSNLRWEIESDPGVPMLAYMLSQPYFKLMKDMGYSQLGSFL